MDSHNDITRNLEPLSRKTADRLLALHPDWWEYTAESHDVGREAGPRFLYMDVPSANPRVEDRLCIEVVETRYIIVRWANGALVAGGPVPVDDDGERVVDSVLQFVEAVLSERYVVASCYRDDFLDGSMPFNSTWVDAAALPGVLTELSRAERMDTVAIRSWLGTKDAECRLAETAG
jgi:hypothetical protein